MACIRENDIYYLTNVEGGTCLDLSGGDNVSIIGYGYHGGPNQAWIFQKAGDHRTYYIKSVGSGKYLSADRGELQDGRKVIADPTPYVWHVQDEEGVSSGVRLLPSENHHFCVDLSDNGNSTPGTPVELWGRWGGQNQVWRLQKVQ